MLSAPIKTSSGCCVKSMGLKLTNDMCGTNCRAVGPPRINDSITQPFRLIVPHKSPNVAVYAVGLRLASEVDFGRASSE